MMMQACGTPRHTSKPPTPSFSAQVRSPDGPAPLCRKLPDRSSFKAPSKGCGGLDADIPQTDPIQGEIVAPHRAVLSEEGETPRPTGRCCWRRTSALQRNGDVRRRFASRCTSAVSICIFVRSATASVRRRCALRRARRDAPSPFGPPLWLPMKPSWGSAARGPS